MICECLWWVGIGRYILFSLVICKSTGTAEPLLLRLRWPYISFSFNILDSGLLQWFTSSQSVSCQFLCPYTLCRLTGESKMSTCLSYKLLISVFLKNHFEILPVYPGPLNVGGLSRSLWQALLLSLLFIIKPLCSSNFIIFMQIYANDYFLCIYFNLVFITEKVLTSRPEIGFRSALKYETSYILLISLGHSFTCITWRSLSYKAVVRIQ